MLEPFVVDSGTVFLLILDPFGTALVFLGCPLGTVLFGSLSQPGGMREAIKQIVLNSIHSSSSFIVIRTEFRTFPCLY